jgi:glycosyltransferase involved in cell wall biosynthesis
VYWSFEIEVEAASASHEAMCSIDFPRAGAMTVYGDRLDVVGWAMGTDSPAAAIEAVALDREEPTARVAPSIPRPDVAAAFPDIPHAGESGFALVTAIPQREWAEVGISVALENGERVDGASIRLLGRRSDGWSAAEAPLVSVIIACYNQAHFVRDAVESVRRQTYPRVEILIVDDGSTDDTAAVAAELGVRCVRQENRGLAGARNRGLAESAGEYVVFLDADDRLLPHGLEANADAFKERPDAAFVASWSGYINGGGNPIPLPVNPPISPERDHYRALLDCSYWIGCPAQAMFRRGALLAAGGYDESFLACEDRDLYLRVARTHVIYAHNGGPVCEYRQHGGGMSENHGRMLKWSILALKRQRRWTWWNRSLRAAYRRGIECAHDLYGEALVKDLVGLLRQRKWRDGMNACGLLARWYPLGLVRSFLRTRPSAE